MEIPTENGRITLEPSLNGGTALMINQGKQRVFINRFEKEDEAVAAAKRLAAIMGIPNAEPRPSPYQEAVADIIEWEFKTVFSSAS